MPKATTRCVGRLMTTTLRGRNSTSARQAADTGLRVPCGVTLLSGSRRLDMLLEYAGSMPPAAKPPPSANHFNFGSGAYGIQTNGDAAGDQFGIAVARLNAASLAG